MDSLLAWEKQERVVSVVFMDIFLISKMHVCSWCMKDWVGVIISWLISTNRKFVHPATWRNTNFHTAVEDYNVHDYKLYTFIEDFKFVRLCRGFQIYASWYRSLTGGSLPLQLYHREQSLPECCCVLWEPWDLTKAFGEDIEIAWMEGTYTSWKPQKMSSRDFQIHCKTLQ